RVLPLGTVIRLLPHCKTFASSRHGDVERTAQRRGPPAGGSGWSREGTLTCQSGGSLAGEALSEHSGLPWLRERLGREKGNSPRVVPSLRGRGSHVGPLGERPRACHRPRPSLRVRSGRVIQKHVPCQSAADSCR